MAEESAIKSNAAAPATPRAVTITIALLKWVIPVIAGILIGVVGLQAYSQQGEKFYSWLLSAVAAGITVSITLYVVLQVVRVSVRKTVAGLDNAAFGSLLGRILRKVTGANLAEHEERLLGNRAIAYAQAWVNGLAAFGLITLAVTLAGTMVILGQTIAAYQQVQRLDTQNGLLRQQLAAGDANASRATYSAMINPILEAIDGVKVAEQAGGPNQIGLNAPSVKLRSLIYAALSSSLTYRTREKMPKDYTFSPERGQLLTLLLGGGFLKLDDFDFSAADLSGLRLDTSGSRLEDQWLPIRLRNAFLRDSEIASINLSDADLQGAILPDPKKFVSRIVRLPDEDGITTNRAADEQPILFRNERAAILASRPSSPAFGIGVARVGEIRPLLGADLSNAFVPSSDWLARMRERVGARGIEASLWRTQLHKDTGMWQLVLNDASRELALFDIEAAQRDCAQMPPDGPFKATSHIDAAVRTINNQRLDPMAPYSQEKGRLLMKLPNSIVKCLTQAGARFNDAFLGLERMDDELILDGIDVSASNFRGAVFKRVQGKGTSLPPAQEFKYASVMDGADALNFEGALVPHQRWMESLANEIYVIGKDGSGEPPTGKLVSRACQATSDPPEICIAFKQMEEEAVMKDGVILYVLRHMHRQRKLGDEL